MVVRARLEGGQRCRGAKRRPGLLKGLFELRGVVAGKLGPARAAEAKALVVVDVVALQEAAVNDEIALGAAEHGIGRVLAEVAVALVLAVVEPEGGRQLPPGGELVGRQREELGAAEE